jgi:hypothetical protein
MSDACLTAELERMALAAAQRHAGIVDAAERRDAIRRDLAAEAGISEAEAEQAMWLAGVDAA